MPLYLKTELDDRSLDNVRRQAVSAFDGIGKEAGEGLKQGIVYELDQIGPSFVHLGSIAQGAMSGLSAGGIAAAAGIAGIGAAAIGVTKELYDLGSTWDSISDSITGKTGAIGNELDGIVDSVRRVGDQSSVSLQGIGDLASGVHSSLKLTGDEGTRMLQLLADIQQVTGQIVNTQGLGRAFRLFDVEDINAQTTAVQELLAVSQATQIPINQLVDALGRTGRAGKDAGLDLEETLGLITALNESGLAFDKAGTGLTYAIRQWAKEGKDANAELANTIQHVKDLIDAGNVQGAQTFLAQVFGGRNYIEFFNAIKDGTLDVDQLTNALRNLNTADIDAQKKAVEDANDSWVKLTHTLSDIFKPAADDVFGALNYFFQGLDTEITAIGESIAGLGTMWNSLYDFITGHPLPPPGPAGPSGPMPPGYSPQTPLGPPIPGANQPGPRTLDEALGLQPPTPAAPPPPPNIGPVGPGLGPNFYEQWYPKQEETKPGGTPKGAPVPYPPGYSGTPVERAQHDVDQANADLQAAQASGDQNAITTAQNRLADAQIGLQNAQMGPKSGGGNKFGAPEIPLPPGYGVMQPGESPDQYRRQQAYLDAVHTREQAQANLEAAQSSGKATADDLTKATNDLIVAQTKERDAYLALSEASSKASDQLGDIGVKLDQDFGLSKGLPGLAENLVRFLGNLGAAGVEGAGRQIQSELGYPGGQGSGSGLMGILGSAGAFGPQYTEAGGGGRFANTSGGEGGAQFPFGGQPGGAFPGGYPQGESGLPITYPGGSPYPASGQPAPGGGSGPQNVARTIYDMARQRGYSHTDAISIVAYAVGESGLNPGISGGAQGGPGAANTVIGLFQQKPAFAIAGGIDPSQRGNPYYNTLAYLNQLDAHPGPDIYSRLLATSSGGPLYTGGRGVMPGLEARARQYLGFQEGGAVWDNGELLAEMSGSTQWPSALPPASAYDYTALKPAGSSGNINPNFRIDTSTITTSGTPAKQFWGNYEEAMGLRQTPGLYFRKLDVGYSQGGDVVPAMLEPGEHVLTTADVHAMGGQSGVYAFRDQLHRAQGATAQLKQPGPAAGQPHGGTGQSPGPVGPGAAPPLPAGVLGAPPGPGLPHAPAGSGPTMIGGAAPFAGYGPGFTITGGGLIGIAESIPASLINYAIMTAAGAIPAHFGGAVGMQYGGEVIGLQGGGSPGGAVSGDIVSAAINIGIEEANRAIGFAGQAAGIGVSGLMEMFLPAGASELANNNWFTRFLGGIVGARPALPNIAGKSAGADRPSEELLGPPPLRTEHYGTGAPPGPPTLPHYGTARPPGPLQPGVPPPRPEHFATGGEVRTVSQTGVHIENYNVTSSEDRAGQDLARHQMNQWQPQSGNR